MRIRGNSRKSGSVIFFVRRGVDFRSKFFFWWSGGMSITGILRKNKPRISIFWINYKTLILDSVSFITERIRGSGREKFSSSTIHLPEGHRGLLRVTGLHHRVTGGSPRVTGGSQEITKNKGTWISCQNSWFGQFEGVKVHGFLDKTAEFSESGHTPNLFNLSTLPGPSTETKLEPLR